MIENKTNKQKINKNTRNTAVSSSKTKQNNKKRRQQHVNKKNMDYAGFELASQRSASSISLLCVTNCATADCMKAPK